MLTVGVLERVLVPQEGVTDETEAVDCNHRDDDQVEDPLRVVDQSAHEEVDGLSF
jgi:hypothetical protein